MQPSRVGLPAALAEAGVTKRELDVLWLVGERLHNSEIAERLYLSERTVESHVSSLLRKLGGTTRRSLIAEAARYRDPWAHTPFGPLPRPLSSFVGREAELRDLLAVVEASSLVTLTGPAGAGKTRLALQVARSTRAPGSVGLADLGMLPTDGDVERALADALGVVAETHNVRGRLREALSGQPCWLVVDNCEHVGDAVAELLVDLLGATPGLHVLATSLGPLHVAGEVVHEVPTLTLPPDSDEPESVLSTEAGRLFVDRAAAAAPGFAVTSDNARAVAGVCRRLDGLPLAIELAAARIRVFSPAELLGRLDDHLSRSAVLGDGAHGSLSRHRTLEAALQWSYDLLDVSERLVFERSSVFPGNFDYDTLVAIAGWPPLHAAELDRLFPRLLDRSMVSARRSGQATAYRLLDSLRHFAHDRLVLRGEDALARERHAVHHLRHGAALATELRRTEQALALSWFERRWLDVRAAMQWALDRDDSMAWTFISGVGTAWEVLGARAELFDWLDLLLERPLPTGRLGVHSAVTAAMLLCYQDTARAGTWAETAYGLALATGEPADLALAQLALGWAEMYADEQARALSHLEGAAGEFEQLGDRWHLALALEGMGVAEPDLDAALGRLARSASFFGAVGDDVKHANCLVHAASRAIDTASRLDAVPGWVDQASALAARTGNHHEWLHAELHRARLEQLVGRADVSGPRFGGLLPEFRRLGDRRCVSRCLLGLGQAAVLSGDTDIARDRLLECLSAALDTGADLVRAAALRLLAQIHRGDDPAYAARLQGAAERAAESLDPERRAALPDDGAVRAALEQELGSERFGAALAEGRERSLDDLLAAGRLRPDAARIR